MTHLSQVLWPYLLEFLVPVEYTRSLSIVTHSHTSPQPYLLEFLVPVEYTRSLSIVCRCVSAEKKREQRDEDYLINFVEYGERRNERAAVHY